MSTLDGRGALIRLDQTLASARNALAEALETEQQASGDLVRIHQAQAAAYMRLADLQIGADDDRERLTRIDGDIDALMDAHEAFVNKSRAALDAKDDEITRLEAERADRAEAVDSAIEAYEAAVAEVEASLEASEAYRGLIETASEAEAVTERARRKLEIASEDRVEKGAPYEADPLFMYLWKRRYRTPDYDASPFFRVLDGWVAGLCKYDRAYMNYDRLTELPVRFAEHVDRMEEAEAKARDALEAAEAHALKTAGADALQADVETAREALAATDARIDTAEAEHLTLADTHAAAEAGQEGPAHEARLRLADALRKSSFPDLRVLVTQTVTIEDDAVVDQLVTLRKDELDLNMRRKELGLAPRDRRQTLARLEHFRRQFKVEQLDSSFATFKASAVDNTLDALLSGRLRPDDALRGLKRSMRRRQPKAHPGFGGRTRRRTSGIPEIAQDIGWQILKEIGRSSGRSGGSPLGFPSGFPGSRRSGRSVSFPKPSIKIGGGRRGGFRTGGGF